ncbi:hypothetical protein [Mogibacterium sp.]
MNIITYLLDIEDNDLELFSCEVQGLKKIVILGNAPSPHFCPKCSYKCILEGSKLGQSIILCFKTDIN